MDGGEAEEGGGGAPRQGPGAGNRRAAPGQIWIACALCGRAVEVSDAVDTVEGHVCPACATAL